MTRKMKDSGVEWIGEMNSNWETKPLKFILKERKQKNVPIITEERLSLSIGIGVTLYSEKTTNLDRFKDDVTQYKVVYPNDLVINSMNVIVGAEGISNYLGCVSPAYYVMYSDNMQKFITKYYDYCFKTSTIQKVLFCLGKGIMAIDRGEGRVNTCRLKVSSYDLGRLEFPVPSIDEQQRIVDYLDNKCTKIEQTIEKQKQLIEKLKEYRQSIISEAVTKGLNPDVLMKDSGIEWIGEIPEHWEVRKLKTTVQISNEKTEFLGQKYVGLENVESWNGKVFKGEKEIVDGISNVFCKGDVLFNKLRPYLAKGFIAEFNGICSSEFLVMRNFIGDNRFLLKTLLSYWFINIVDSSTYGAKMPRASWSFIGEMLICYPDVMEQQQIAEYLDKKCTAIDKSISQKQKLIEKLTEYKKSLIYECVTGKREV